MKYWAKSLPPLTVEKRYFETTLELMKWAESLIKKCNMRIKKFEDHFVLLKIDDTNCQSYKKIFIDTQEEKISNARRKFPMLSKYYLKEKDERREK